jgi:hypothetical protein
MTADDSTLTADSTANELPKPTAATVSGLVLRPILMFVAGYVLTNCLHELAHALTAYWLGIPSTLFHFYLNVNLTDETLGTQALVRAAGPLFSLVFGVLCWLVHRGIRGSWLELPFFYLAVFGVANFLGNTVAVAFVGDFSNMTAALRLSTEVCYAIAGVGLFLLIGFAFDIGRELREWVPAEVGAFKGMLATVAVPAIVGTALVMLIYQPMAMIAVRARVGEAAFWIFVAVGALVGSARPARAQGALAVRPADWAFVLLGVLAVRVLALGIPLDPPQP